LKLVLLAHPAGTIAAKPARSRLTGIGRYSWAGKQLAALKGFAGADPAAGMIVAGR
jgi:hypothetical protein